MGWWILGTHLGSWNQGVVQFQQQIIKILMNPGFKFEAKVRYDIKLQMVRIVTSD